MFENIISKSNQQETVRFVDRQNPIVLENNLIRCAVIFACIA